MILVGLNGYRRKIQMSHLINVSNMLKIFLYRPDPCHICPDV